MKKIIILLIPLLLLTGCWNYRELNEMAIVGSLGIDYNLETEKYEVVAQVFNAKKTSSGGETSGDQSPVTLYEGQGDTISEALRNITSDAPKQIYIGYLSNLIIGETLAQTKLEETLDFLFRSSESTKNFDVILAKGHTPIEVLSILTTLEGLPSDSIAESIVVNSTQRGVSVIIPYDQFIASLYETGQEAVLPIVEVIGDIIDGSDTSNTSEAIPKSKLEFTGLAVFKQTKLQGYLDEEESIGYNFITDQIDHVILAFACSDTSNASVEVINSKSKMTLEIKNNVPTATIKVSGEATITEVNCKIDISQPDNVNKLKQLAEEEVVRLIKKALTVAQSTYQTDIFGYGNALYRNHYQYWQSNKANWAHIFSTISTDIEVELLVSKKGSTITTTKEGLE